MYLIDEQILSTIFKKNQFIDVNHLLIMLTDRNFPRVAKVLLRTRNDVDVNHYENGMTPLMIACHWSETAMTRLLLAHPNIDIDLKAATNYYKESYKGQTAFEIAQQSQSKSKLTRYFENYKTQPILQVLQKKNEKTTKK